MEAHCNENVRGHSVFLAVLSRNGGGEFGASIPGMHSSFIHGIALFLGINCYLCCIFQHYNNFDAVFMLIKHRIDCIHMNM